MVQIQICLDFHKGQKQFFQSSLNRFSIFWPLHPTWQMAFKVFSKKVVKSAIFWWFSSFTENWVRDLGIWEKVVKNAIFAVFSNSSENIVIKLFWKRFKIMKHNVWHNSAKTACPEEFWFRSYGLNHTQNQGKSDIFGTSLKMFYILSWFLH